MTNSQPGRPSVVSQSDVAGGAERYLTSLYGKLRDRGYDPRLLGHVPGWTEAGLSAEAAPLGPKWDGRSTLKRLPRLPAERAAVAQLAARAGASSFHVQFKREQIGLTDRLAKSAPVLWTEHGRFKGGVEGRVLAMGYRQAAKRVSTIICVSSVVAGDVRRIVGDKVRIEVVPNAIDTTAVRPPTEDERTEARRSLDIPEGAPVLAWVSQVHPGKQPMLAVEAARLFPGVTLMAGAGVLADDVRAAADGDQVRFLGYRPDPSLLYRAADAFLFTSAGMNEGLPTNSILEAAAHGLPVIANAASGFGAEAEATGGHLALDTPQSLADAALLVVKEREARAATARGWALRHDVEPWTTTHEEILRAL